MAKGQSIVVSGEPHGRFIEGVIGDGSLPGSLMMLQSGQAGPVNGRFTWVQANYGGLDGVPSLIAILVNDFEQGQLQTTAPGVNTLAKLYIPGNGDEVNVLVGEVSGGGTQTFTIGQRFMIDADGQGLIPLVGTPQGIPFVGLEAVVAVAVPYLMWALFTGAN